MPFITEATVSVDTSVTKESKWGEQTSIAKVYTISSVVKAGPGTMVTGIATVNRGLINVPYTIHLSSKSTGKKTETKGIWRGISTWEFRTTYIEEP